MVQIYGRKPTRDGFGEGVVEAGGANKNIVVLCADLTDSTRANWFKEKFPDRFIACGVAEQDMFGIAAGLALSGKIPFACTFGVFASGRGWDQIRVSIAYMNLNVKIIGTHGGISVGPDGATHQALEEIALMRTLPNMTVLVPCDQIQAKKATLAAIAHKGPVYIRLGRSAAPIITTANDPFEIGKARLLHDGKDVTIIACGHLVYEALKCRQELLEKSGIEAAVIDLHTIKPIDKAAILNSVRKTGCVVTCEEHTIVGGVGSAVLEALCETPVPLEMIGIRDCFGESGEPDELFEKFGLTARHIAEAAKKVIKRK